VPNPDDDVPSGIDLQSAADAHAWASAAEAKNPWREAMRGAFAHELTTARRVLELGSGPGFLAERVLRECAIESYTLFDFSRPMLELSRERIGVHAAASFVLGDFKQPGWAAALAPFDAVIAMQAIHEIRHKRHVPGLYREIFEVIVPGGQLLVCDHEPSARFATVAPQRNPQLFATLVEQLAALESAGFTATALVHDERKYLVRGVRA
jgi:ubiquinone/menaquinone biosynthesis C-methylase UbiE